jgi:hypothetical protein
MSKPVTAVFTALILASSSTSAMAAITSTTSASEWAGAVSAVGVDTYNDLAATFYAGPLARTAGAYGYSASAPDGLYPGTADGVFMSTNTATDVLLFDSFTGGATAVGGFFFNSDSFSLFTPGPAVSVTVTTATGSLTETILNPTLTSFLGFYADSPILSVSITAEQPQDATFRWPSVDNFALGIVSGGAVPEPSSWAMLIAGFGLVGAVSRRRRQIAA